VITAAADAFSLALGAAVGRYGPAVQLGATLGSVIGQKFGLGRAGLRVLLGCGVAGAISASFNAPIAGAIFAHEVIIGHFALRAFAPVTLASVAAVAVTRYHGFEYIALKLHDIHRQLALWDYPLYVLVGGLAALVALLYMKGILGVRWSIQKAKVPIWLQPMIGGVIAGAMGLGLPAVLGLGDYTMQEVLEQDIAAPAFTLGMITMLLGGKLLASVACLGCRFPGGMFSPALFLGAMLGGICGMLVPSLDYQICVLVGMGAVVASVVGAPIATILIVFELTENYAAATAVMVGVVASNALVTRFFAPSFFHRQIQLWGYDLDRPPQQRIMEQRKLAPMVVAQFLAVRPGQTVAGLRAMVESGHEGDIYVTESDGRLVGKFPVAALLNCDPDETAGRLATFPSHWFSAEDTEWQGFIGLKNFVGYSVPVVEDSEGMKLIGVVFQAHFIAAYRNAVATARQEQ
jgi:CIC family chloride channel protein